MSVHSLFPKEAPSSLAGFALTTLKLFDRRFPDELTAPVFASDGVDAVFDIGGYPHEHGDGFDFGFEWRASHAEPCALFRKNRQFVLQK